MFDMFHYDTNVKRKNHNMELQLQYSFASQLVISHPNCDKLIVFLSQLEKRLER